MVVYGFNSIRHSNHKFRELLWAECVNLRAQCDHCAEKIMNFIPLTFKSFFRPFNVGRGKVNYKFNFQTKQRTANLHN